MPGLLKELNNEFAGCLFQVGDFVQRRWSSRLQLAPPALPEVLARLLAYAFSVSAAVALLNAAPIVLLVHVTLFTWPVTPSHTSVPFPAYAKYSAAHHMGGAGGLIATAVSHRPASGTCVVRSLPIHLTAHVVAGR